MNEIENKFLGKSVFGKYKVIKKVGTGAYSSVFIGQTILNEKPIAVKIQDKSEPCGNLENEAYYLFQLKEIGFPKIYSYGQSGKYNILVEELLGKTLEELFIENKKESNFIRLKDMLLTAIQVIDRVKTIHLKNIIHLDIKPSNFLIGNPNNSLIYLIDFGFAKKYRSSRTGKHIKYGKTLYFKGNLCYSSLNQMKGIEPSRRDDLESLGYMLVFLYTQNLPWYHVKSKNKFGVPKKILEIKSLISIKMICEDSPKEMNEYLTYVKSLKFDEEPNYDFLKKLFQYSLQKLYNTKKINFSWSNDSLNKTILLSNIKKRRISHFSRIFEGINQGKSLIKEKKYTIKESNKNDNSKETTNNEINNYFTKIENNDKSVNKKNIFFLKNNLKRMNSENNSRNLTQNFTKNKVHKTNNISNLTDNESYYNIKNDIDLYGKVSSKKGNNKNNNNFYNLFISPIISNNVVNIISNNKNKININLNKYINKEQNNNCLNKIFKGINSHFIYNNKIQNLSDNKINEYTHISNENIYKETKAINVINNNNNNILLCSNIIYKRKFNS